VLLQQSRIEDARRVLERSSGWRLGSPSHTIWHRPGLARGAAAIAEFEAAVALDPNYAIARLNLARVRAGRRPTALEAYEKGFSDGPGARHAERAARVLERQGRFDDAPTARAESSRSIPTTRRRGSRLAHACCALGAGSRPGRSPAPGAPARFVRGSVHLGIALEALDLPDEALEAFRAAAALRPNDPDPLSHRDDSRRARAMVEAGSEYEQTPRDADHFSHLNLALVAERRPDDARRDAPSRFPRPSARRVVRRVAGARPRRARRAPRTARMSARDRSARRRGPASTRER
jgi:tetratricopeptide (TPR) repeat protein